MSSGRINKSTEEQSFKLPEIGSIRVGFKEKTKDGTKEFPKSVDYFIASGNYADLFNREIGEKKSKIQVVFASDNVRDICYERFEAYTPGGVKLAEGDGVTFEVWDDNAINKEGKKGDYVKGVPAEDPRVQAAKPHMKRTLTLKFVLPAINGVYGQWKFSTRAKASSIDQIIGVFDYVMDAAGRVSGIPFDLQVTMAQKKTPNGVTKFPVVTLIPNLNNSNLELVKNHLAGLSFGKIGMLTDDKIKKLAESGTKELPATVVGDNSTAPYSEAQVVDDSNKAESSLEFDETGQLRIT